MAGGRWLGAGRGYALGATPLNRDMASLRDRAGFPARSDCYNCNGQGKVFAGTKAGYVNPEIILECPICKGTGLRQYSRKVLRDGKQGELFEPLAFLKR